jgi:hypothetical protein
MWYHTLHLISFNVGCLNFERLPFLTATLYISESMQAMLADFFVENCGHFFQKNASPYFRVSHKNFSIFDVKKEPTVI